MEQDKIDVASRARFMSRRLKIMNTSPALVKIEDNDDEETKRLLQKKGKRVRMSARHHDAIQARIKRLDASKTDSDSTKSENKIEEKSDTDFIKKVEAMKSSLQQIDLNKSRNIREKCSRESVRNINVSLLSRKKNLIEMQMLPEINKKFVGAPIASPRGKMRVVSIRKRNEGNDDTEQKDGAESADVENSSIYFERNKGPPRKPPRRKLRVSTRMRKNSNAEEQVMTAETKPTTNESDDSKCVANMTSEEQPIPKPRQRRFRLSRRSLKNVDEQLQESFHQSVVCESKRQKSSNEAIIASISSKSEDELSKANENNEIISRYKNGSAAIVESTNKPKSKARSRARYRKMLLAKYLAAAHDDDSDDSKETAESVDFNTTESEASTKHETTPASVQDVGKSFSKVRQFSIEDIEQAFQANGANFEKSEEAQKENTNESEMKVKDFPNNENVTQAISYSAEAFETRGLEQDRKKETNELHEPSHQISISESSMKSSSPAITHEELLESKVNDNEETDKRERSGCEELKSSAPTKRQPKILKKHHSCSSITSLLHRKNDFQISRIKNDNPPKIFTTRYVQTDESFLQTKNAETISNSPQQPLKVNPPAALKSNTSDNLDTAKNLLCFEKSSANEDFNIKDLNIASTETDIQSHSNKTNLIDISEDSENENDDDVEIEYTLIDEDGNELSLDEETLAESLTLLEDSEDEIEVIYEDEDDDSYSEELVLFVNDDGQYVDEDGNIVEVTIRSDDEIVYEE